METSYFSEEKQENVAYFGEANKIKKLLASSAMKIGLAMGMASELGGCGGKTHQEENADCLESAADANSICANNPVIDVEIISAEIIAGCISKDRFDLDNCKKSICGAKFELLIGGLVNVCNIRYVYKHRKYRIHVLSSSSTYASRAARLLCTIKGSLIKSGPNGYRRLFLLRNQIVIVRQILIDLKKNVIVVNQILKILSVLYALLFC